MIVKFYGQTFFCTRAIKSSNHATLYLEDGSTVELVGVNNWSSFSIEGGAWTDLDAKTLEQLQETRQEENKAALAAWLAAHPLTWTDGKRYGVEEQDQNEMALNLMQYQAAASAGQVAPLEWHAQKEACREFTQEEYLGLSMAISAYVYPYRRYQESVKESIYNAQTAEEVAAVVIDYASVEVEA